MSGAYLGDPAKANRLYAARKKAGFKSGRAAALHFGWSASTYCSHETASRFLADETAKIYAAAFDVKLEWLLRADGAGPPIDPVREASSGTGSIARQIGPKMIQPRPPAAASDSHVVSPASVRRPPPRRPRA